MKVILDTNVLVAGLRSNKGASFQILKMLPQKIFTPLLSVPLFFEYEAVLKREHIHLSSQDIDMVLNMMAKVSKHIKLYYLWRPISKDPADDMVLELAVSGGANVIVTFNLKDFEHSVQQFKFEAVTPRQFLSLFKEWRKK